MQVNTWSVTRRGPPVSSYTAKELEEEVCASDGPQDSIDSCSFRMWLAHHSKRTYTVFLSRMQSTFAYTMWDYADLSVEQLEGICTNIAGSRDYFKRHGRDWTGKDLRLAERRKKDIYNAGGRGYWPKGGLDDFSGIANIRDRRREQLIQKWKMATENGEDEDPLDLSARVWYGRKLTWPQPPRR